MKGLMMEIAKLTKALILEDALEFLKQERDFYAKKGIKLFVIITDYNKYIFFRTLTNSDYDTSVSKKSIYKLMKEENAIVDYNRKVHLPCSYLKKCKNKVKRGKKAHHQITNKGGKNEQKISMSEMRGIS